MVLATHRVLRRRTSAGTDTLGGVRCHLPVVRRTSSTRTEGLGRRGSRIGCVLLSTKSGQMSVTSETSDHRGIADFVGGELSCLSGEQFVPLMNFCRQLLMGLIVVRVTGLCGTKVMGPHGLECLVYGRWLSLPDSITQLCVQPIHKGNQHCFL